ncbi:MAG: SurA N-terminal domain-containing protein [Prevotellaceae bacterium]|jgi:peptidyl-prolyl cis-trans isomerase D|nr:SurA N-terminal domain-containing protein [Prevotellaceae bacterium]
MATLGKIRSKGVLLIIVIGAALLIFIVTDFINNGTTIFNDQKDYVGIIGKEKVKYRDFSLKIEEYKDFVRVEQGDAALNDEMTDKINQDVWNQMVYQKLIEEDALAIGMTVPTQQLQDLTVGNNISQMLYQLRTFQNPQTGGFDVQQVINLISNLNDPGLASTNPEQLRILRNYWRFVESNVKGDALSNKYSVLLSKALVVNSLEAKYNYENTKTSVNLVYAMKPYFAISDSAISVPDEQVKQLYNNRREQFKQEPAADISYVVFPVVPSVDDFATVEQSINEAKHEFFTVSADSITDVVNFTSDIPFRDVFLTKNDIAPELQDFAINGATGAAFEPQLFGDVYKMARIMDKVLSPDSIKLNVISVNEETPEAANHKVDSLINLLRLGMPFAQVASQFSADTQTKSKGGEFGWIRELDLPVTISSKAFYAPLYVPFVIPNVNNLNMVNIFMVTERTRPVTKVRLAVIEQQVNPSSTTETKIFQQAKQFASESKTVDDMKANAAKNQYNLIPMNNLNYNTARLGNIKNSRQVILWAINKSTKLNTVSDVKECDNNLIVATVTRRNTTGYAEFDEKKTTLLAELTKDKKFELLKKEFEGKDIATLKAENFTVDTVKNLSFNSYSTGSLGNDYKLIGLAPSAEINRVSAPIEGNIGAYVFQVLEKIELPMPYDEQQEKTALASQNRSVVYTVFEALKKAGKVRDERYKFF